MLIKDRKLILQVWSMNSCCSEPLPSKLYNNSFKAVLNLKGNCSLLKNICQFLNFMKNSFRKWWHFWHDVIYLFTGNDSTRTDKMCYRHFCAMQKQQTRSLPSCTEYELPVSIAKRPVKPLCIVVSTRIQGVNAWDNICLSCFSHSWVKKVLAYSCPQSWSYQHSASHLQGQD